MAVQPTGPKSWEILELEVANAINVGDVIEPDLHTNGLPLLKIFEYDRWEVTPEDLELLKPSIQFASNLVRAGMPYIASFLPVPDNMFRNDVRDPLHKDSDEAISKDMYNRSNLCPNEIDLKDDPTKDEVAAALDALELLGPFIRWQTDSEIYSEKTMGWLGVTRLVDEPRPWSIVEPEDIAAADEVSMRDNLVHRPLIIAIAGEFVDAIRNSPKTSEQRLRNIFTAAVTMAHEVGHAVFHQDFRSFNPPDLGEPYVGDGVHRELGINFITSIFNGFHPDEVHSGVLKMPAFTRHLNWVQHFKTGDERPKYKTLYSIPMNYVQEKLTNAWWDGLPSPKMSFDFSSKAKEGLKPVTDPDPTKTATAREAEWRYSWQTGEPKWNFPYDYRMLGLKRGDKIDVSEEEIEWQKAHQPKEGWDEFLAGLDPQELKQKQKRNRELFRVLEGEGEGEDEEEDFYEERARETAELALLGDGDGILEKDIIELVEDDTAPLTRIIVRYLPPSETTAKRSRGDDSDDDDLGPRAKKAKPGPPANTSTAGASNPVRTKTQADDVLERSSPSYLVRTMTRLEIHNMCENRNLPGYEVSDPTHMFWKEHPDVDVSGWLVDSDVVNLLSDDLLNMALITTFKHNDNDNAEEQKVKREARIQLKRASLTFVNAWSRYHLSEFCSAHGMDDEGSLAELRKRIEDWKRADIEATQHEDPDYRDASPPSEPDKNLENLSANPEDWSLDELKAFCLKHDLPGLELFLEVGSRIALVIRVRQYLAKQAIPEAPRKRHTQHARLDNDGFEVYNFLANRRQSTVAALKSALFIVGKFPPEAILTLSLRLAWGYLQLGDDRPLFYYTADDCKKLRLKVAFPVEAAVAETWNVGRGSTAATAIDVDAEPKIHYKQPHPLPESSIASVLEESPFSDEPPAAKTTETIREDPPVERDAALAPPNTEPTTVSELLTSVGNRAARLDQFVRAGGRFSMGRAPEPATSGLSILEEVEDYEEEEEDKRREPDRLMEEPEEGGSAYPAPAISHMADLFHATNTKWTPPPREDDDETEY